MLTTSHITGNWQYSFWLKVHKNKGRKESFYSNCRPAKFLQFFIVEHFLKWKPYCKKHGVLILELHTVDCNKAQENIGDTLTCAYDATHGYSDQYIISLQDFLNAAQKAGFEIESNSSYKFPNNEKIASGANHIK